MRFVQKHLLDLRTSLQHCSGMPEIAEGQSSDGTARDSIAPATEDGIVANALQQKLRQLKEQQTATVQPEADRAERAGRTVSWSCRSEPIRECSMGLQIPRGQELGSATRRGHVIAKFPSESKLDEWWVEFHRQAGRSPEQLAKGSPQPNRPDATAKRAGSNHTTSSSRGSGGDYMRPWSDKYGMPEYDLE